MVEDGTRIKYGAGEPIKEIIKESAEDSDEEKCPKNFMIVLVCSKCGDQCEVEYQELLRLTGPFICPKCR